MTKKKITRSSFLSHYNYLAVVNQYIENPDDYVRSFNVRINGKLRKIITYQPNSKGKQLRSLHSLIASYITQNYTSSSNSYAYKKSFSVAACLNNHMENCVFLKTDIHSFFDSISYDVLNKKVCTLLTPYYKKLISHLLKACFYNDRLPIGFVSSPVLSDLFLSSFDAAISNQFPSCVYTRYADDFILSMPASEDAEQMLLSAKHVMAELLALLGLSLNENKTYIRKLKIPGDAIHVLGLNIVYQEPGRNKLTVSDKYIREVSFSLCDLINRHSQKGDNIDKDEFIHVYGKAAYIIASSPSSAEKLRKMLSVKLKQNIPSLDYENLSQLCGAI